MSVEHLSRMENHPVQIVDGRLTHGAQSHPTIGHDVFVGGNRHMRLGPDPLPQCHSLIGRFRRRAFTLDADESKRRHDENHSGPK